jgi:putative Mn2+ efflux pump MntP
VSLKHVSFRQTFRLSWHFGLFQAMMPVIGWSFGSAVSSFVEAYDHWLAFALLFLVGGNMMREAFDHDEAEKPFNDATRGMTLVMLSVATSIDALAVGFSMSLLNISIITPAVIIGVVAGVFTVTGLHLGTLAASLGKVAAVAELAGGLVLWAIGLNILLEHGVFRSLL